MGRPVVRPAIRLDLDDSTGSHTVPVVAYEQRAEQAPRGLDHRPGHEARKVVRWTGAA